MPDSFASTPERRATSRTDRRKHPRSGRRASDPHFNWRRIGWLFAVYAVFLSLRSLPSAIKKCFANQNTPTPT
ncbi:MAG TPA: hypothetical protein VGQ16_14855 [Vicinamibacterales bacterium]|nr:hypothetical protein [Vicinamibacterales bacterium]